MSLEEIDEKFEIFQRHYIKSIDKNVSSQLLEFILSVFYFQQSDILDLIDEDVDEVLQDESKSKEVIDKLIHSKTPEKYSDITIFIKLINSFFEKQSSITFGIETYYIDREYRDSYYSHYSEWHLETSRYCWRLVLFSGNVCNLLDEISLNKNAVQKLQKRIMGTIVIRPIKNASIGRTLIDPYYLLSEVCVRRSKYRIYYSGIKFTIRAFPFSMQDRVTTSCAEVTLLNILDYYSNQYTDYQFLLPSQINNIIKKSHYDRVLPTSGLSYQNISRVLYKTGFSPKLYFVGMNVDSDKIRRLLSYYVESGMPVAIGIDNGNSYGHSIICIGHGKCDTSFAKIKANQETIELPNKKIVLANSIYSYNNFIVQDDARLPYHSIINKENDYFKYPEDIGEFRLKCLVAPLYRRMYMDAQRAETTIMNILTSIFSPVDDYKIGLNEDRPLIYRLFLASSRHFKQFRMKFVKDDWLNKLYREIALPQFVWVCELYNPEGFSDNKAFGEIVLDATYSGRNLLESCLLINYPNKHLAKDQYQVGMFFDKDYNPFGPYDWLICNHGEENIYPAYTYNLYQL